MLINSAKLRMLGLAIQKSIVRALEAQARLAVAIFNLGPASAVSLFFWHRLIKPTGTFRLFIRKLRRPFYFRGNIDWGIVTHFYKPGYVINDRNSARKVGLIIDAGANIGTETLRFRFFHPTATIVSIEAEKGNFDLLCRNTAADLKIFPVNAGLHSKSCKLKVTNAGSSNESFRIEEVDLASPDFDVVGLAVPQLIETYKIDEIDILKLDIEGAERWVFDQTADAWIHKVRVIIFECPDSDAPGTTAQIFDVLRRNGIAVRTYLHGECLVLIRHDVDWTLEADLLFDRPSPDPLSDRRSDPHLVSGSRA